MAIKNDKETLGALAVIGLIGGVIFIRNVICPWFYENNEVIMQWVKGILCVAVLCALIFFPVRSIIRKRMFISRYGGLFDAKDRITQESITVMRSLEKELSRLGPEVQQLLREASSC